MPVIHDESELSSVHAEVRTSMDLLRGIPGNSNGSSSSQHPCYVGDSSVKFNFGQRRNRQEEGGRWVDPYTSQSLLKFSCLCYCC